MNEEEQKTEQAAVADSTNETPKEEVSAESGAAQDDGLDELLKEFDQRAAAPAPEKEVPASEPKTPEIDVQALAVLEQRLNQQEAREQRRELERVFNRFAEGTQADAIDAEAFLNAAALRDPRINQAYASRASSPKAWDKIEGALKNEFARRYGKKVDKQVTESRDAVASAVRSASTAAPSKEITDNEIKSMSKDDFDDLSRKLGITPV
ncbi:MAG TPA: hypothetical protein VIY48_07050 [Candidatus Paceibacterota bacterium]